MKKINWARVCAYLLYGASNAILMAAAAAITFGLYMPIYTHGLQVTTWSTVGFYILGEAFFMVPVGAIIYAFFSFLTWDVLLGKWLKKK